MEFEPQAPEEKAGLAIVQDEEYHISFLKGYRNENTFLQICTVQDGVKVCVKEINIQDKRRIYLTIQCNIKNYCFYYGFSDNERISMEVEVDATMLSTTVNHGFTGVFLGMYATVV